ncbi:maltose/maltodextrin ABC transporter, permease protein MalF (plasmid) [Lacticaseibacillus paracasei]|nr:maltose/maltodextrin ABC transporter, permease protein MalF [Lacticaseibacillus paracasei]
MGLAQLKRRQVGAGHFTAGTRAGFHLLAELQRVLGPGMLSNLGANKTKRVVFDNAQGVYLTSCRITPL